MTMITVKKQEIVDTVRLMKEGEYEQVFLMVQEDGTIEGRWFFGRSDFVLKPGFIVLFYVKEQTEETLVYTIMMILRNQEGYGVTP